MADTQDNLDDYSSSNEKWSALMMHSEELKVTYFGLTYYYCLL